MDKIRLYKSSLSSDIYFNNDRGYKELSSGHIYLYVFKNKCFLLRSDNEDYVLSNLKNFIMKENSIAHNHITESFIKGDLKERFLMQFDVEWFSTLFKNNDIDYCGFKSLGLVGDFISKNEFSARFYNCFGDLIFKEDVFSIIHEVLPNDIS